MLLDNMSEPILRGARYGGTFATEDELRYMLIRVVRVRSEGKSAASARWSTRAAGLSGSPAFRKELLKDEIEWQESYGKPEIAERLRRFLDE